jgi:hypothetical protein
LITLGGVLLAGLVVVGTWLYVAGHAPPFPLSAWAFNGLVILSTAYALLFGRPGPT